MRPPYASLRWARRPKPARFEQRRADREPIKAEQMTFGRWIRLVGWRHMVADHLCIWALFPVFYMITLAFSGGNTLTAACPPDRSGLSAVICLFPSKLSLDNFTAMLTSDQWPFDDLVPQHGDDRAR